MWVGEFTFLPVLLDRIEDEQNGGVDGIFCFVKTPEEERLERGDEELEMLW